MDPSKHGMHLQLVEAYREGTLGGGDVKLIEMHVPWGASELVVLTVRLRMHNEGEFRPDYCMHQYASLPVELSTL